jgi:hypothetical protein
MCQRRSTVNWQGPWAHTPGPLVGGELAQMRGWLSGRPGVYAWMWQGMPGRPMYVGKATSFWGRFSGRGQHHGIRATGGYSQYDAPPGIDFWCWFGLKCHDPERVLLGLPPSLLDTENPETPCAQDGDNRTVARHRARAAASWARLTFCFAEVDLSKLPGFSLEDIEVHLRWELDGVFDRVVGWNPSRARDPRCRIIFGGGAREYRGLAAERRRSAAR